MSSAGVDANAGSPLPVNDFRFGGNGLGLIGTAPKGPAFVPLNASNLNSFIAKFGNITSEHFGQIAAQQWLSVTQNCAYVRILGIGDGKKRVVNETLNSDGENLPAGGVKNSGFVVGARLTGSAGTLASNPFAVDEGLPGRTYFLGAFMSESAGSRFLSDAGIQRSGQNVSAPILRGVLFAASGVLPALSGCYTGNASTASIGATVGSFADKQDGGATVGSVKIGGSSHGEFVLLLNGHVSTAEYPNVLTASFDLTAGGTETTPTSTYFSDVFNTDPTKIQEAGHYLYTHYDIESSNAILTGSGIVTPGTAKITAADGVKLEDLAFLVTASIPRNAADSYGSLEIPNFENFNDRFTTAASPMVISQRFNRKNLDLLKFHALDDGEFGSSKIKITFSNIKPGETVDDYGSFDVTIREINNVDTSLTEFPTGETYANIDLNPSSDRYIARVIGDRHEFYAFDRAVERQRQIVDGNFPNFSKVVRVEMSPGVTNQSIPKNSLPVGYRGYSHLVTSGSSIMSNPKHPLSDGSVIDSSAVPWGHRITEPPIPYRIQIGDNTNNGDSTGKLFSLGDFCWGVKTTRTLKLKSPNVSTEFNKGIMAFGKHFPNHTTQRQKVFVGGNTGTPDSNGTIFDADRFNNNMFSLENILIHTRSDADLIDNDQWLYAQYRRDRKKISLRHGSDLSMRSGVRFLDYSRDFSDEVEGDTSQFLKYSMILQGGSDGFNIFSKEKTKCSNLAAYFESSYENQGFESGPTIGAYMTALRVLSEKSDADIRLLATPGMRIEKITNAALAMAEERFDAFYIMDIEQVASGSGLVITSSNEVVDVKLTAERFKSRALNTSFTAAYFPDVSMFEPTDTDVDQEVFFPPSIHALRVYGVLDATGNPFAPAGVIRGALSPPAIQTFVNFASTQRSTIKQLFSAGINPIIDDSEGLYIFSGKTAMTTKSALQNISVRRMIMEIRRLVRALANNVFFEYATDDVLRSFQKQAAGAVQGFFRSGGVRDFKVKIDTTTTTQADIEANTIRGQIIIQPARSEEIIQVDF